MKTLKTVVLAFALFSTSISNACTIFCGKDSKGHIWAGNNEDGLFTPATFLNVFPKSGKMKFGYYTLSYESPENGENSNIEGAMNEGGLFFDMNALDASRTEHPIKDIEKKKSFPGGDNEIFKYILTNFDKVEQVITFFDEYWFDIGFNTAQIHFADRYGNFGMISPSGSRLLKGQKFQVSTNFEICGNEDSFGCWRFPIATEKLTNGTIGLELFREICESTAQHDKISTIYSNIQNLSTGEIWFYYGLDYKHAYKTSLTELINKGRKSYLISDLFNQNALSNTLNTLKHEGGAKAFQEFNSLQLPEMEKEGVIAILANIIADDSNNLEAIPFVDAYLKIEPMLRSLQTTKAIYQYYQGKTEQAITTITNYKKLVPDTSLDVPRVLNRLNGNFDENANAFFELNGYQDAKAVLIKGFDKNTGNFMFKKDDKWILNLKLEPGIYNYKYVVDGVEVFDSKTPIVEIVSMFSMANYTTHQLCIGISNELYETTIKVKVPNKEDVVYIAGNQPNLTYWNSVFRMKKTSDLEREITLKLHLPAQFKFTKGSWNSEAIMENGEKGQDGGWLPLKVDLNSKQNSFEIIGWKNLK
jgi:hypothetical protein